MKPKLSFPAGRANENSVLLRPCVRPALRTSENFSKIFFPRAPAHERKKNCAARRPARANSPPDVRAPDPRAQGKKNVIEA